MKMFKMKCKKKNKRRIDVDDGMENPTYPWGLSLSLENESIENLEIKDLPKVGAEFDMVIKVSVTRVSKEADEKNERKGLCLQITEMGFVEEKKQKDIANKLYG